MPAIRYSADEMVERVGKWMLERANRSEGEAPETAVALFRRFEAAEWFLGLLEQSRPPRVSGWTRSGGGITRLVFDSDRGDRLYVIRAKDWKARGVDRVWVYEDLGFDATVGDGTPISLIEGRPTEFVPMNAELLAEAQASLSTAKADEEVLEEPLRRYSVHVMRSEALAWLLSEEERPEEGKALALFQHARTSGHFWETLRADAARKGFRYYRYWHWLEANGQREVRNSRGDRLEIHTRPESWTGYFDRVWVHVDVEPPSGPIPIWKFLLSPAGREFALRERSDREASSDD